MIRKYVLPLLANAGVVFAIMTVMSGSQPQVRAAPAAEPARSTFVNDVAGAGLIEASTQNIRVGAVVPGVVTEMYVNVGDTVKAGDPLFKVDDRQQVGELAVREAEIKSAESELSRLKQQPRAEDIPPLEAAVQSADAALRNRQRELERVQRTGGSASADEIDRARLNLEVGEADLMRAQSEMAKMKAGAWSAEIAVSEARLAQAKANRDSAQIEIDRRTIRSPKAGRLLQVNVRLGEFAQVGPLAEPLMLMGDVQVLHIRVDIDENDAWRVRENRPAKASVRGNSKLTSI